MFIIEETVGVEERGGNGNSVIFAQFFWKLKILLKIKSIPLKKLNHCLFQKKKGGGKAFKFLYTHLISIKRGQGGGILKILMVCPYYRSNTSKSDLIITTSLACKCT